MLFGGFNLEYSCTAFHLRTCVFLSHVSDFMCKIKSLKDKNRLSGLPLIIR